MEQKPEKKLYQRWWLWLIIGIFIIGIAAAYGSGGHKPTKAGETHKTGGNTIAANSAADKTKTFKIGDIVQLKDYKITVNKIRTTAGTEFDMPKDGNEFFYVDCTVENISSDTQTISSMAMFKVEDKDGRSYDETFVQDSDGQLDGDLAAGRKMSGEYVVEVPKGKKGLDLVFDSSLFTGGQAIVDLN